MSETFQNSVETECGFGKRLRALRKQRAITQEKCASDARMSVATWAKYEKGASHPTLFNLIRITMVLGLDDDEVIHLVLGDRSR